VCAARGLRRRLGAGIEAGGQAGPFVSGPGKTARRAYGVRWYGSSSIKPVPVQTGSSADGISGELREVRRGDLCVYLSN